MSKILDAMRQTTHRVGDFRYQLNTVGGMNLFPPPTEVQMVEFEKIADSLINLHPGTRGQVVVFSSTVSGEGGSFISYNIARHMVYMLDRRICWVDGNFHNPQTRLAGSNLDFRSLLSDPDSFEQLNLGSNLALIPNGDSHVRTTNLLSSENYASLIRRFEENFFFTIIDAPSILDSVDIARMCAPTMGLVVVVESRKLKHEVVRHGINALQQQGVRVLGTVLNKRVFDIPSFLYDKI